MEGLNHYSCNPVTTYDHERSQQQLKKKCLHKEKKSARNNSRRKARSKRKTKFIMNETANNCTNLAQGSKKLMIRTMKSATKLAQPPRPGLQPPLSKTSVKGALFKKIMKMVMKVVNTFQLNNLARVIIRSSNLSEKNKALLEKHAHIFLKKTRQKTLDILYKKSFSIMLAGMYLAMSQEMPLHIKDSLKIASAERRLFKNNTTRSYG